MGREKEEIAQTVKSRCGHSPPGSSLVHNFLHRFEKGLRRISSRKKGGRRWRGGSEFQARGGGQRRDIREYYTSGSRVMKPFPAPSCYYPPWQYKPDKDIGGWYVAQLHPATPSPFCISWPTRPSPQPPQDKRERRKTGRNVSGITRRHRHSRA